MAGLKIIKKRIVSVKNIRKITKTMELVSAAKSRKMMVKVHDSQPYGNKMIELLDTLSGITGDINLPLLRKVENPKKIILLVITANRGLCGGYNAQLLKLARQRIRELQEAGIAFDLHVIGKKGLVYFKFVKVQVAKSWTNFDDNFKYHDARALAEEYLHGFLHGEYDRLEVISTRYISAVLQRAENFTLFPMTGSGKSEKSSESERKTANVLFQPSAEEILKTLLPHMAEYIFYRTLLEAVTSEQIARRIAMKAASDAAADMNKSLTRMYNRKRQAAITQELAEIVAGADAIK
jgi:F-type H+-transporting ATPase subunit gamma